jgi:hypothetical protein
MFSWAHETVVSSSIRRLAVVNLTKLALAVELAPFGTATYYYKGDTRTLHSFFPKCILPGEDCDYLEFYIEGVLEDRISGDVDWSAAGGKSYQLTGSRAQPPR